LVNGTGLVNGNGMINGNGFTNGLSLRRNRRGVILQKDLRIGLSLLILFVLLVPPISLLLSTSLTPAPVAEGIVIDGAFGDWADAEKYSENLVAPENIKIEGHAVDLRNDYLSFYIKVNSSFFPYGPDMFEIFMDADGNAATGYETSEDFGSDYRIELYGWDGEVKGSILLEFSGADRLNFSAWKAMGSADAAINLNELEAQIDTQVLELFDAERFKVLIFAKDSSGSEIYSSVATSDDFGALAVRQVPLLADPVVTGSQNVTRLVFMAKGTDVNVSKVNLTVTGGVVGAIAPFKVPKGTIVPKTVTLDVSSLNPGTLVRINLDGVSADRPVKISGIETRVYATALHQEINVDGLFYDWETFIDILSPDLVPELNDSNIDIERYSTNRSATEAFFYMRVDGDIFAGSNIPDRMSKPPADVGGPSGPTPPPVTFVPRKSGEDVTKIFIDTDVSDVDSGMSIGSIRADFKVEIKGINGRITEKTMYRWTAGSWSPLQSIPIEAEIDDSQLEASVPLSSLGAMPDAEVVFVTTDWRAMSDSTVSHEGLKASFKNGEGTKSGGDDPIPLHGINAETAFSWELSSTPTVDGSCDAGIEYPGSYLIDETDFDVYIGHINDYVYICVIAWYDSALINGDQTELFLDPDHQGGSAPQDDDRYFIVRYEIVTASFNFYQRKGDGTFWVPCGASCDPGNEGEGSVTFGVLNYEFKLGFGDVWEPSPPSPNQVAGFQIVIWDGNGGGYRIWGSDSVPWENPNDWGHLGYLPEFQELIIPIAGTITLFIFTWRKRRK
jgi:hypothetical protein